MTQPNTQQFLGREREMEGLLASLEAANNGRGQLVMLVGEPGIGKTRIAQELARLAQERGGQVLWGWCYEGEGAPPYWPWVGPIRTYVQQTEPGLLRAQLGPGIADVAGLVPEVADKLGETPPLTQMEPEQARFRLFDAVSSFFKQAAADQPILLVLEDLHWADEPSLLLLQFLARQIDDCRLMVVITCREAEAAGSPILAETSAQLSRLPTFRRHILGGLDIGDVHRFFQGVVGQSPSADLVQSLHAHTDGNPFFLVEVIRLLDSQGNIAGDIGGALDSGLGLPQGVRDVIGQRLRRLPEQCNLVLSTASVVGREFDFRLLGMVMEDISENDLLGLVEQALDAHVIEEAPGQADRYQFAHALVQQTLLEGLSSSRKVRLHALIGEALETRYGDRPESHAAELAHHFFEAAPVLGPDKLVRYALMAGLRALAANAHEEAVSYFTQGLNAKEIAVDGEIPAPDEETAALLFGIGRAQAAIPRRGGAQNITRAFDYYALVGDVDRAVEVAQFPLAAGLGRLRVTGLISRALEIVPPDSLAAAGLLSRYGLALGQETGDYEKAMSSLNRALSIAQEKGDKKLEMWARANAAEVNAFNLHYIDVINDGPKMRELARQVDIPQAEVIYRFHAMVAAASLGLRDEVEVNVENSIELAESIRHQPLLAGTLFANAAMASMYDFDRRSSVRELTDRGFAAMPGYAALVLTRALFEYDSGDQLQGRKYLERLLESARHSRPGPSLELAVIGQGIPLVAEITGSLEHLDAAALASNTVLSYSSATPFIASLARSGLAMNMLLTDSLSDIEVHYEALKKCQGIHLAWLGVDRLLGQISRATGRVDQAIEHFGAAIDFCQKSGIQSELARVSLPYAGTLLDRGGDGDRKLARALLDEALTMAEALGMGPLREQLTRLQDEIPKSRQTASYPGGLTQRETDVIRLIAQGKTDREIAEELVISVRTVTTHVGNILNKTGAANRAEAASFATRHGLD